MILISIMQLKIKRGIFQNNEFKIDLPKNSEIIDAEMFQDTNTYNRIVKYKIVYEYNPKARFAPRLFRIITAAGKINVTDEFIKSEYLNGLEWFLYEIIDPKKE